MIQAEKYQHALRALNAILVRARWLAHEGETSELADLLDAAEILPKYIAQPEDMTEVFRDSIADIAERYRCAHLVDEFDQECARAF